MELNDLLEKEADEIVTEAVAALRKGALHSYEKSDDQTNRARVAALFDTMRTSIESQDLVPMVEYSRQIAHERCSDGFNLQEVLTAYNVLEEVIWRRITVELPPKEYARSFGLVSTVIGAGKEVLAVEYVALAGEHHVHSIDFAALFRYGQ